MGAAPCRPPAWTPSPNTFADESYVFERAYLGSFPTVPNRRDLMSGQYSCTHSQWGPLPPDLVVLQQVLSRVGVTTMMIVDTPHLIGHGFDYCRGFDGFEWVRGQENDHFRTAPRHVPAPAHPEKWRSEFRESLLYYLRNTAGREKEEELVNVILVMSDTFRADNLACYGGGSVQTPRLDTFADLFDPHEPWCPPEHYLDLYDPGYDGLEVTYPRYGFWEEYLTPGEMRHCQALYAGEVTMVDHWFGRLLDKIDELDLQDETAVIFTSDHGFLFGEHGFIGKSFSSERGFEAVPLYQEISHIPLLIRAPGQGEAQQMPALAQTPDLMPTVLELAGVVATETISGQAAIQVLQCGVYGHYDWRLDPAALHGRSLVPLMRGETSRVREISVASHTLVHPTPAVAKTSIVTEDGWCLHYAGHYPDAYEGKSHVGMPFCPPGAATMPIRPALYYLPDDPGEVENRLDADLGLAREIHQAYVAFLESVGTPEEYLAGRRELGV